MIDHRHASRVGVFTGAALFVLLAVPTVALAQAHPQENRFYLGVGGGIMQPLSDELERLVDVSGGWSVELGYLVGLAPTGSGGLGIAPNVTFKMWDLNDTLPDVDSRNTWNIALTGGLKAGYVGGGAFVYGLADAGVNYTKFRVCGLDGACDDRLSEADFLLRLGGGLDFAVARWVAIGVQAAVPVTFSDDDEGIGETISAFEAMAYVKFMLSPPIGDIDVDVDVDVDRDRRPIR